MSLEQEGEGNDVLKKLLQNSDLFGTGNESDSESEGGSQPAVNHKRTSPETWEEEREEEEGSTSPEDGATKKRKRKENNKMPKPKKAKKTEVQMMYSDSQKLVRESSVNLPKYQARPKSLDGFLTRLRQRKLVGTSGPNTTPSAVARLKCSEVAATHREKLEDKENSPPPLSLDGLGSQQDVVSTPLNDNSNAVCSTAPTNERILPTTTEDKLPLLSGNSCSQEVDREGEFESESNVDGKENEDLHSKHPNEVVESDQEDIHVAQSETDRDSVGEEEERENSKVKDEKDIDSESTNDDVIGLDKDEAVPLKEEEVENKKLSPPSLGEARQKKQQPTLLTLFASNAAQQKDKEKQKSLKKDDFKSSTAPLPAPGPSLSNMDDFLLENEDKLTVDVPVIPVKPLTPMERFQQRLMKHMSTSSQPVTLSSTEGRVGKEEVEKEGGEKGGGVLVPDEVITKLKDKPGAVREHWKSALRKKLSKSRAEERKAMEEKRKLYSEEVGGETDEEEAELTDGETSDEEYLQDEEAAKAGSDVCSDLDDDYETEKAEPETEQLTNDDQDDSRDLDSNEDDDSKKKPLASQGRKRGLAARRVLDSDDEEEMDVSGDSTVRKENERACKADSSSEQLCLSSTFSDNTMQSASLFEDTRDGTEITTTAVAKSVARESGAKMDKPKEKGFRRPSIMADLLEEASMPPLMLNDPIDSEDSSSNSSLDEKMQTDKEEEFKVQPESADTCTKKVGEADNLPSTQPVAEEEGGGDPDNSSLELSLLWQPSMPPPAQVRKDSSEDIVLGSKKNSLTQSTGIFDGDSQWPVRGSGDTFSISEEVDEETQFLDANGFLYVRKERQPRDSPLSAIKDTVDPTQESSPSELLALCSGQFAPDEDAQLVGATTTASIGTTKEEQFFDRSLSDSSTQGVRELLGLTAEPTNERSKPTDSIARLFSSFESGMQSCSAKDSAGFSSQLNGQGSTQQIDEVIGLCSGIFPTTQMQINQNDLQKTKTFKFSSRVSNAGTSDGMSNRSSDEEGEERKERGEGERREKKMTGDQALLRWAKRQRHLQERAGVSRKEGESDSDDEDMPVLKRRRIRLKQKPSKQDRLAEFVESEAELSGSDVGSDHDEEDFLYAEQDYEEDEGAGSDLPLSDSELKEQINKVHMKHTLADDKANLRDLQERFLKEGDLYEDGLAMKNGFFRTRHFNRNGSEAGSLDLFADDHHSDGEGGMGVDGGERVELNSQAEAKRRKDRLEREEFIRKFREKEGSLLDMDDDSQSILGIIKDHTSLSLMNTPSSSQGEAMGHIGQRFSSGFKRTRGSFLKQTPSLRRNASSLTPNAVTSTATPTPVGVSTGRGFVFQKGVPRASTGSDQVEKQSRKTHKRSANIKKPKLDRSISAPLPADTDNSNSIFSILKY